MRLAEAAIASITGGCPECEDYWFSQPRLTGECELAAIKSVANKRWKTTAQVLREHLASYHELFGHKACGREEAPS